MLKQAEFIAYLQKVCSDPLISALLCHFLCQPGHFIWSFCNILGTLDQRSLVSTATSHQTGHFGHQKGHPFSSSNDVITLERKKVAMKAWDRNNSPNHHPHSVPKPFEKAKKKCFVQGGGGNHCSKKSTGDLSTKAICELLSLPKPSEIKLWLKSVVDRLVLWLKRTKFRHCDCYRLETTIWRRVPEECLKTNLRWWIFLISTYEWTNLHHPNLTVMGLSHSSLHGQCPCRERVRVNETV